jgi:hypothetical protein
MTLEDLPQHAAQIVFSRVPANDQAYLVLKYGAETFDQVSLATAVTMYRVASRAGKLGVNQKAAHEFLEIHCAKILS